MLTFAVQPSPSHPRASAPAEPLWPAVVEAVLLLVTAPLLYFPERVHQQAQRVCGCDALWLVPASVAVLVLLWPLRRALTGRWGLRAASLPVRWAWGFWLVVMLPVAVWAAPMPLRAEYAWPRALILVWNFSLFWSVLAHAGRTRRALGWALVAWLAAVQAIALVAPFGMEARSKLPVLGQIQDLIPRPLLGVFAGAEEGFSTNQVAGVLLYVLPLLIALCVAGVWQRSWRQERARVWVWWVLLLVTGWMGATLLLTQSRGGLLGLLVAMITMALLTRRGGGYALALMLVTGTLAIFLAPTYILDVISDAPGVDAVGGVVTVRAFRLVVWAAAVSALRDFFFTGMGLGTFRVLVHLLYPLPGIPASMDLAHAHNFFLQTGLDFGVPGLIAILVVYAAACAQLVRLTRQRTAAAVWPALPWLTPRVLGIGWLGCMVGQTVYSLFDAVAMGSKPNFVWWWWLALILAAGRLPASDGGHKQDNE